MTSSSVWLCLFLVTQSYCVDPLVELSYSIYNGRALSNSITQWLGIRYAAPPLGDLRFEAPQDPATTSGVQAADQVRFQTRSHTR